MSQVKSRLAGHILLLIVSVLTITRQACGDEIDRPKSAPWNIQAVRQKYYAGLDQARQEAVRKIEAEGLSLSYNTDGSVIHDEALEKATQYYQQSQHSLLNEVRSNSRREQEFQALSQSAGAAIKREGGAQPGQEAYSGALSDRDVELNTKAQVESLTEEARKQGYHVVTGPGYVKILELDTVVWEPFRSHGPGGVELRHDDPEVMLSYEVIVGRQKASVTQQVKKIEEYFREDIPDSTQKQHELVAGLAKAVTKSADAIKQPDQPDILDEQNLDQYQQLKSRKLTKDDLISPFDRPEAQERQLQELRRKAGQNVRTCDAAQAEQRQQRLDRLKEEQTTLSDRLDHETDDAKRQQLKIQISDAADQVRAIENDLSVDVRTRRAISRKNPQLADAMGWNPKPETVIPDRPGELARISRVIDDALEISQQQEPRDTSATDAFDALAEANRTVGKVLNSPFFSIFARVVGVSPAAIKLAEKIGKASKAADKNVISPTQDAIHSEGFVYETGDGMKEYIARRLKEEAAKGWDITNPRLQELIHREAILRATARGTYQGAKVLPGLGNIIQGYEDTFNLTESSVGLVYDTWKSQQTADMNRFQQEGQLEKAILQAKESRERLRKLMDTAAKAIAYSKDIEKFLPSLNAEIEQLEQQIKDRRTQLDSLGRINQPDPPALADSDFDPQTLSGLRGRMEALTRIAKQFTADCEKTLAQIKSGKVPREQLLEERGILQRRMMEEIDAEYLRIATLLDQVTARIGMVTEPDEVRTIHEALMLDFGQALVLASTAEEIAGKLERYELHYKDVFRCFTEERKRILEACDFFSQRSEGDENLQKRLSQMRGEMTEYRIPNYQLQENWNQGSSLKREAFWLRRMAADPPSPPAITAVSPALRAEGEQLQKLTNSWKQPEAAMTAAVEEARARFQELRDLLPLDPPAFSITAEQIKPLQWKFIVESVRVPEDATLAYSWDFGDGAGEGGPESRRQHLFAKPGAYTVRVRVFLERNDHSEDLGEVSTLVTMGDPMPKPPGKISPGDPNQPVAGRLMVSTTNVRLDGEIERPAEGLILGAVPAGQYYADSVLTIAVAENHQSLTAEYFVGLRLKLNQDPKMLQGLKGLFPPYWNLDVNGTARGPFNPQAGNFRLAGNQATWTESVSQGVDRISGSAQARRLLGVSPDQLEWTGEITGELDWKNFGGGQGRLQINQLVKGNWKVDPLSPYQVSPPANIALNGRLPIVRVYPNESLAIKSFIPASRTTLLMYGSRRDVKGFGDQAIWTQRAMLIRSGRWHFDYSRTFSYGNPESYRASINRVQQFIEEEGLEEEIPILPDR